MRALFVTAVFFSAFGCAAGTPPEGCTPPAVDCGGTCIDTASNPLHCGACGATCLSGEVCSAGMCGTTCASGVTACDGACVDTVIDPLHCGACGNACEASELCVSGTCELSCAMDTVECDGACVDLQTSTSHCGVCGNACRADETCVDGGCDCAIDFVECSGTCADLMSDPMHCSGCGLACSTGESCFAGVCAVDCGGGGMIECSGACVDTLSHMMHCGGCDMACRTDQTCVGGTCECDTASMDCDGACVDPLTSPLHCGGCDMPCTGGGTCVGGACECPGSLMDCGSGCVDLASDPANCGGCGTACTSGMTCMGSTCVAATPWSTILPVSLSPSIGFGDLVFLPGGDILATTSTSITRVSRTDGSLSTFASGIPGAYSLGVTYRPADGLVYASNNTGGIFRITAGAPAMIHDAGSRVHSLTIAPATFGPYGGQIIATVNNGQILAIDPAGPTVVTIGTRATSDISDAAFAPDGTLYLVDYRNNAVHTMTSGGVFTTFLASGLMNPDSIAIDPSGTRLWVVNSGGGGSLTEVTIPGAATSVRATFTVNFGDNVTGILHDGVSTLIHRTSAGGLATISL